jgi:hypothetical protein
MLFKAYIDESYNNKLFTLSCLMSDRWAFIESKWKRCLREKNESLRKQGRPQISRYHAADCSSRKGDFKGWTVEEQIEFTTRLIGIFNRNFVNVIAYSMPLDEFVRVFPGVQGRPRKNLLQRTVEIPHAGDS